MRTETNFTAAKEQTKKIAKMTGAILSSLESFDATSDELTSAIETARNSVYWQQKHDLEAEYKAKSYASEKQITTARPYPALSSGQDQEAKCEPSIRRNF